MSLREMPTPQHTSKFYEMQGLHDSIVALMLREMQREVNTGHPFECRLHLDYSTNNHPTQLHAANDLDCCFMDFFSWRKPVGPRIMRKLWSNFIPGQSAKFANKRQKGEKHNTIRFSEESKAS